MLLIMLIYYDNRRRVSCRMYIERAYSSILFRVSFSYIVMHASFGLLVPAARLNMFSKYWRQIVMGNSPTEFPTG